MSTEDTARKRVHVHVHGIDIHWDEEGYLESWAGGPALGLWIESSLAGLMAGMQRMVGTERFNLMIHAGGRDSVDGDWAYIRRFPTFEEGFEALSIAARVAGWGIWRLVSIDREAREARFRVDKSCEALYQRALGVAWGSSYFAGKLSGICTRLFETNCWAEQTAFIVHGDPWDEYVVRPSDQTLEQKIEALLAEAIATSPDVAVAMEKLRREIDERIQVERKLREEVEDRKKIEEQLREQLELVRRQQTTIRQMSTPIIQVWEGVLTLPVIGTLSTERATDMMERLLNELARTAARYVIVDLTGVEVVDTLTADHLIKIVRAVELMGAQAMITGLRPGVAQTMVALGTDMTTMTTRNNLQEALRLCMRG